MTPDAERERLVDQLELSCATLRDMLWQLAGEPLNPDRSSQFDMAVALFWSVHDLLGRLRVLQPHDANRLMNEWLGLSP